MVDRLYAKIREYEIIVENAKYNYECELESKDEERIKHAYKVLKTYSLVLSELRVVAYGD